MTLLGRALSERGHRVAHVIYPPRDPVELAYPLTLVHREPYARGLPVAGALIEAVRVWQALAAARARVMVVRSASPAVGVAAVYCRLRRRALVFSSANVSDFTLERMPGRLERALYRLGVRLADIVVVQSDEQRALAEEAFPGLRRVVLIPSFAEPPMGATDGDEPRAFLWFGRFVSYKQPLRYLDLAEALPEARFIMIPVPDEATSDELAELRAAAERVPNLELREPIPHEQLLRLVASAVAIVNTSALEGMPNAFLEAWSHGVPVLTLQFDPDDVVDRHELGISAQGSWNRFVAGAHELWEQRDEPGELSRRVRAYVDEVHSMAAVGARWSDLVTELERARAGDRPSSSRVD